MRDDTLQNNLPVIHIIDSISRARSPTRLERSHGHEHAETSDEQRSLLGFHHNIPFQTLSPNQPNTEGSGNK
jgi:hypothetical protein